MITPTQAIAKWKQNLGNAQNSFTMGVQGVTVSPMQKAADNAQKYVQGVQNAVNSGKWQAGLTQVSLADWQKAMTQKGWANMQTGINNLSAKAVGNMTSLINFAQQLKQQIASMPKATLADSKARVNAVIDAMHQYGQTRG